jgi:hypothetical protein
MPATSRWVQFDASADTYMTGATSNSISGTGTPGYAVGQGVVSGTVTLTPTEQNLRVALNGESVGNPDHEITLTTGTNLDCRMVAQEIAFKLKQLPSTEFDGVSVEFLNNKYQITSSKLGTSSSVSLSYGTSNDCSHLLGISSAKGGPTTVDAYNGTSGTNNAAYTGQITIGGTYRGQFDDIYTVMVGTAHPVSGCITSGSSGPIYYTGSGIVAGDWNLSSNEVYTVTVSVAGGPVMNAGTGHVPTITWTSTQADNNSTPIELLYADHWYKIGTHGVRMKFTDGVFAEGDTFRIYCVANQYAYGTNTSSPVGSGTYAWSSLREGKSSSVTTTQTTGTAVGTKGVTIAFSNSGLLTARDAFRIICSGPQPTSLGVTVLNFGSVTVSTYSPTKVVWFELMSGATKLLTPKFGLQSHGTAQHHNSGNSDTYFAFGSSGEGFPAISGGQSWEWKEDVQGNTDLSTDKTGGTGGSPVYLYQVENNMPVVSTADQSILVGVAPGKMISDFLYLAIKLGALETGANPSIIWRCYYDFS